MLGDPLSTSESLISFQGLWKVLLDLQWLNEMKWLEMNEQKSEMLQIQGTKVLRGMYRVSQVGV